MYVANNKLATHICHLICIQLLDLLSYVRQHHNRHYYFLLYLYKRDLKKLPQIFWSKLQITLIYAGDNF